MRVLRVMLTGIALGVATAAAAQPIQVADSGDSAWLLSASLLVMIAALPGLTLVYARGRHGAIALFATTAIVSLLFVIFGYSLAFSPGGALIGDSGNVMLGDLADLRDGATVSDTLYALFELAVALFAVAILVAAVADRARFGWCVMFAALWFTFVYVPVAHWMWGDGWLSDLGAVDFAGGVVVQLTAGVGALVATLLIGKSGETALVQDSPLTLVGATLVWIGGFAVIGGGALSSSDDAAGAILNTQMAVSAAVLTGIAIERWRTGGVSMFGAAMAAIAGLAAISAGAGFVGIGGAIALGVVGALGAAITGLALRRFGSGGGTSAFVAHGGGAIVGAIVFPIFMHVRLGGPGFEDGMTLLTLLTAQTVAVLAVTLWTAGLTAVAALMSAMILPMRHGAQL